ncbi:MAG: hypothetical protein H0X66_07245 [Verrucomicrobia bacterium]|nr:hypothetical protein [Verrucomicrobiota bacterium]
MKVYLVKEHMALPDGQRETITAAYLDRKNAEEDAHSHLHGHYTHWMVDEVEIKDARRVMKIHDEKVMQRSRRH